jgi:hypothetical protein
MAGWQPCHALIGCASNAATRIAETRVDLSRMLGSVATRTVCTCPNDDANEAAHDEKECSNKMKSTMIAALSIATAATALPLAATAHADNNYQQFASPSGTIRCILNAQDTPAPIVVCQIGDHTYVAPPGSTRDGGPCEPGTDLGRDFRLDQGKPAYFTCTYSALGSGFGPWPTLDYGQTRSLGTITCDSEPSGVTCTDSSTGHFFRVASDSYQLG